MAKIFSDEEHCPGREELIHTFLDGELSPAERELFGAHLAGCPACQLLLAEWQPLWSELAVLAEVAPPAGIAGRVMVTLAANNRAEVTSQVGAELSRPVTGHRSPVTIFTPTLRPRLLGQLALAGQIVIGLALLLMSFPAITLSIDNQLLWLPWLAISDLGGSLAGWGLELIGEISRWTQTQWPQLIGLADLPVSPRAGLILLAGLALAWFIGNALLLNRYPRSLKIREVL